MFVSQYLMLYIVLLLSLWAAIAFSLFVIKPLQTRWAVTRARKIVASGRLPDCKLDLLGQGEHGKDNR